MRINFAHLRIQGVDVAIFDADATSHSDSDRARLLSQLTAAARLQKLKVDKSALAFATAGRLQFYGTTDLVKFLVASGWYPQWTHWIDV